MAWARNLYVITSLLTIFSLFIILPCIYSLRKIRIHTIFVLHFK